MGLLQQRLWGPGSKRAGITSKISQVKPSESQRGTICVDHVSMVFRRDGKTFVAVEGIDLQIEAGEFVALLGPSGCGKSTLLNMVAGIHKPTIGKVLIDGQLVKEPTPICNVVFQQHSLFPWMSALENVAFGPKMLGHASPEAVARTFLGLVGLEKFAKSYPMAMSGGMQQRVAIARALATYPMVLLMDEPFGALDAQTRSIMQEELLKVWANFKTTVLFVTHDIDEAVYLADRIMVMRILPGGIKEDIKVNLPRPRFPELVGTEKFGLIRKRISELIREESLKVFNVVESH